MSWIRRFAGACLALLAMGWAGALLLPAQGSAMTLMTEDNNTLAAPLTPPHNWGSPFRAMATERAGWIGASHLRALVMNERGFGWGQTDAFVDNALENDFTPYLTIGYRPWASELTPAEDPSLPLPTAAEVGAFCEQVATRYGDRVDHYSVFNEPNFFKWRVSAGSTTATTVPAATYGAYFRACAGRVRAVDPGAKVYFGELAAGTAACRYVTDALVSSTVTVADGLAFHPYQEGTPPWTAVSDRCSGIGRLADWESLATNAAASSAMANLRTPSGTRVPLLVTEFGYCNIGPRKDCTGDPATYLDDITKATWLAAAYRRALDAGVSFFSYYHLVSFPDLSRWDSGIVDMNGTMSPAARALRAASGTVDPAVAATPASGVFRDRATLNGLVNPHGGGRLTYWFEFGQTTGYGRTTARQTVGSGTVDVAVSAAVAGLEAGVTHHYRLHVKTRAGVSVSADQTVTLPDVSRPAVVAPADGTRFVFYRGPGGRLWVRHWDGTAWRATDLGIATVGSPSAGEHGDVYAYARGANGHLWQFAWTGTAWTRWDTGFEVAGDPAFQVGGATRAAYVRGANGNMWQVMWNGSAWTHWDMGLAIDGTPTVVSDTIVVRGANGNIWEVRWTSGGWTHWDSGRASAGDPAVLIAGARTDGPRSIWFRGVDGDLHQLAWNGSAWLDWDTGVVTTGDPTVIPDRVYYRGAGGTMWQLHWTGSDWTWWDTGHALVGDLAFATQWGTSYWYFRGAENHLFQISWDATASWQIWDMGA